MRFVLQINNNGFLTAEANVVRELVDAENEWYGSNDHSYTVVKNLMQGFVCKEEPKSIPVGSIEFCNTFASDIGADRIPALNVPPVLRDENITGRKCFDFADERSLIDALQDLPNGFVVKPGDYAKRFDAFRMHRAEHQDLRDKQGPYFASEWLVEDIEAEWRVFFYCGEIVGARPYILHSWVAPNADFAKSVLSTWGAAAPKAGTLDIAILLNGRNVLLETHPLIACGFYGFEDPILLQMLRAAWQEHIQDRRM